jgi:hypothetical protein
MADNNSLLNKVHEQYQHCSGGSTVEKPAETQTSIWLTSHFIRAPNSLPKGHKFESPAWIELGALTEGGKTLGVKVFLQCHLYPEKRTIVRGFIRVFLIPKYLLVPIPTYTYVVFSIVVPMVLLRQCPHLASPVAESFSFPFAPPAPQQAIPSRLLSAAVSFATPPTPPNFQQAQPSFRGSFCIFCRYTRYRVANLTPSPNWSRLRSFTFSRSAPKNTLLFSHLLVPDRNEPKSSPGSVVR